MAVSEQTARVMTSAADLIRDLHLTATGWTYSLHVRHMDLSTQTRWCGRDVVRNEANAVVLDPARTRKPPWAGRLPDAHRACRRAGRDLRCRGDRAAAGTPELVRAGSAAAILRY